MDFISAYRKNACLKMYESAYIFRLMVKNI